MRMIRFFCKTCESVLMYCIQYCGSGDGHCSRVLWQAANGHLRRFCASFLQ